MKKIVFKSLKGIGILLLVLMMLAGGVYYKSINYNRFESIVKC